MSKGTLITRVLFVVWLCYTLCHMDLDAYLEFAKKLAYQAGDIMREYFNAADQGLAIKADKTPVTAADKLINELVIGAVEEQYPKHGVMAEERSTNEAHHADLWVCDPIDGTKAFIWGVPTAMFSLAYVHAGTALIGVAYDPFQDKLYSAVKGQGSWCNGKSIAVSKQPLKGGIYAAGSSREHFSKWQGYYDRLEEQGAIIACFSGAVYKMMLIAQGKMIGYAEGLVNSHDIAAAKVIVEEAGGKVTLLDGSEPPLDRQNKGALVTNGVVHQELLTLLAQSTV